MKSILLTLVLLLGLPGYLARAQAPLQPLGIALETYDYPHPVNFLSLTNEGQTVRMAYMDVNPSGKQAVVLLHGKNFFGAYWQNTIAALTNAHFRVVVPDQVGFGKSSKPDMAYSFDLLAANTAKLLDELKIQTVAVLGHSMGGMLAVRIARNYPERVTHLVMENPIGLEDYRFKVPPQSIDDLFRKEMADTDPEKIKKFYQSYAVKWNDEIFGPYPEVRARVTLSGEYPRWAKASALTYQMIYQQPVRHEFPLLKTRTLLVIGLEDRTTLGRNLVNPVVAQTLGQYPELGKAAARDIPNATLLELTNISHIPHLEAPEKFHEALINFLQKR